MARSSQLALAQCRILAGVLIDEEINFRFEVWAYWRMSAREIERHYRQWRCQPDRPTLLKNKTVRLLTNFGMHTAAIHRGCNAAIEFTPSVVGLVNTSDAAVG